MPLSPHALKLLDGVETVEMRSLEWGFTDGSLSEKETLELAALTGVGGHSDDLVEELIEAKLLLEIKASSGSVRIRSRFGEMMRLLAASRQLFPNKPWQGAPRLVADFRVDRRPRQFPRRHRSPAEILSDHEAAFAPSSLRKALWSALTDRPNMKMSDFQERALLRLSNPGGDDGTIITAGTGSGKTIAFYIPAMIEIGEAISSDHWVKAIAIYPRIELLKDQFAEAYRMARALDAPLKARGVRSLRIGALFGATPRSASLVELAAKKWVRRGSDFVCPWLRCPRCDGDLVWREADIEAGREGLSCARPPCGTSISEERVILTRRRLQQQPPDILFTTTEILNQRLSDQWMRHLFGVGVAASKRPIFALLDEVHTYEGASGAQAALTLRRWRHLLDAPISWVGLSATLGDATRFFGDLTGANADGVVEITPDADEFDEEGAEYQILLRGDPSSRASLLSTTIQSSMLLPRALDPPGDPVSKGAFGCRAFLFTDDLDVTNRLYDDLRDAEAYTIFGRLDQQRDPLAKLREGGPDAQLRDLEGQRWRLCEEIGHPLDRRLIIGRTTSQDAGVNQTANIVVATAALEVGFNDPEVGAVIQHKAPRGMASFLQRKGRAGRDRAMRPITLTILSDYGRDRAFYQAYEHLFDPTLETQHLPIRNPYVLKIHAVLAMIDWLSATTANAGRAWFWDFLSRPVQPAAGPLKNAIEATKKRLTALVQGEETVLQDLRSYLGGALGIDSTAVDALLWEPPRSLLLEAVPTLVRRLFRQWELAFPQGAHQRDLQVDYHPLPDFVPRNLFSDLSLPEVRIVIPPATVRHEEHIETLPILQALNQLVPGRVTRRFAFERGALSHWVPVDPANPVQERRISDYAEEHEFVGSFRGRCNDRTDEEPVLVFRPWQVRLHQAARTDALPSSNARLAWRSDIEANGEALIVGVPPRSPWKRYIQSVGFHLHRFRGNVSVRRFAPTANANVRTLQDDFPVIINFTSDDGRPAALGFELEVDGFYLELALPPSNELGGTALPASLHGSSRTAFARDRFLNDPDLPDDCNPFQRDWLFQILVSALIANAAQTKRSLGEAASDLMEDDKLAPSLEMVMDELFGAAPSALPDDDEAGDEDPGDGDSVSASPRAAAHGASRLQQALAIQLTRAAVREALRSAAGRLASPQDDDYGAWIRRTLVETLGEAMLQACVASAPRHATMDTLLLDIEQESETGTTRIWITESTIGGAGVLQAFAGRFSGEPRAFFSALEAALAPTDLELVDAGLREILDLSRRDTEIADHLARLRSTNSHAERATLWQSLATILAARGAIDLSHALGVSLNSRLLRQGSGPALNCLLISLQEEWDALEEAFGCSMGLREFAYVASKQAALEVEVRAFLAATLPPAALSHVSTITAIASLLWPRENELRQRVLQSYNPYRQARSTDPELIRHLLLTQSVALVNLSDADWQEQLQTAFERQGMCRLRSPGPAAGDLRRALVRLAATPIDVGHLQFFPVVERIERAEGLLVATLTLREQV